MFTGKNQGKKGKKLGKNLIKIREKIMGKSSKIIYKIGWKYRYEVWWKK